MVNVCTFYCYNSIKSWTTGATSGAGTAYPSGTPEFTPGFSGVRVTWSLVLCVCFVDSCLSCCPFSFIHCVVCPSSLYGFWLPLWYLQILLKFVNSCLSLLRDRIRGWCKDYLDRFQYGRLNIRSDRITCWFSSKHAVYIKQQRKLVVALSQINLAGVKRHVFVCQITL